MTTKIFYLPVLALFIGALTLTSCKKEGCTDNDALNYDSEADKDDGSCTYPDPEPVPSEPFFVKVDGSEFQENDISTSISAWTQTLSITATNSAGQYVELKMPSTITTGTYTFGDPFQGTRAGYYFDGNSIYAADQGTGTLNIVSHNTNTNTITGFFSYDAVPYSMSSGNSSYVISQGEFVVTY